MQTFNMDPCEKIFQLAVSDGSTVKVHVGVLCQSSGYLRNATKPEWCQRRPDPNTIDLTDHTVDEVKLYVQWLYGQALSASGIDHEYDSNHSDILARAYVFGEKIIDIKYKNAVLSHWLMYFKKSGPIYTNAVGIIYGGTTSSSPARRLLADMVAHDIHLGVGRSAMEKILNDLPHQALIDAMMATAELCKKVPISHGRWISVGSYMEDEVN